MIRQGLFSATKHVLGALVFAEKHGAAGVKVNFVDEHYSDAAMDDNNYWGYFYNPVLHPCTIACTTIVHHGLHASGIAYKYCEILLP